MNMSNSVVMPKISACFKHVLTMTWVWAPITPGSNVCPVPSRM